MLVFRGIPLDFWELTFHWPIPEVRFRNISIDPKMQIPTVNQPWWFKGLQGFIRSWWFRNPAPVDLVNMALLTRFYLYSYVYIYICQASTSISFLLPFREDGLEQGNCWNDVFPIEDGDSEIMFRKDHSVLSLISHSRKLPWTSHGPQTWMVKFAQECSSELWEFSVSISQMLHGDIPDLPGWMFFFIYGSLPFQSPSGAYGYLRPYFLSNYSRIPGIPFLLMVQKSGDHHQGWC